METDSRIYVAGHRGLAGSAIGRRLHSGGYTNLVIRTHEELDLTNQIATQTFFKSEQPEYVFLAAAKLGGILANETHPAEFIHQNLAIQTNIMHEAWRAGVKRLIFLGSSCIYPRDCPQPIKEEYLLTGPLEPTNRAYAMAKIAGIEMCWSYNRQYGTHFLCVMPTNLYGPGDNYDLQHSHVLPALIRKMHEGKLAGAPEVVVWGSGTPRREFLYSEDMADGCVFLMQLAESRFSALTNSRTVAPLVNLGSGKDMTILELAEQIAKVVGFKGALRFDRSKPDGTPRKLSDCSRIQSLGWCSFTCLTDGLTQTYASYASRAA